MRIQRLLGHPEGSTASQFASIALLAAILLTGLAFAGRLAYAEARASQTTQSPSTSAQASAPAASASPASSSASTPDAQSSIRDSNAGPSADAAQQDQGQASQEQDESARLREEQLRMEQLREQGNALQKQYNDLASQASQGRLSAGDQKRLDDAKLRLQQASREWNDRLQQQMGQITARLNSPEYKKQMADLFAALAKINTPEFRRQLDNAMSPELRKLYEDSMKSAAHTNSLAAMQQLDARLNSPEFRKQWNDAMAAAAAKMNSPEFSKQLDDAMKASDKLNTPEFREQMEQLLAQQYATQARLYALESAPQAPSVVAVQARPIDPESIPAGVIQQNLLTHPNPIYPSIAKAAHVQGVVVLHARISKEGKIEQLNIVSGSPMLAGAALDAVRQWTYRPYTVDGQPVEVDTTINVNFSFGGDGPPSPAGDSRFQDPIPPTDSAGNPVRRIGDGISAPQVIYQVAPEFTTEARKAKFMGIVLVGCIVNEKGVPEDVHVVRGVGMGLNDKAIEAVKQYRFKPAMEDGKLVPVELNIEVNFQIF